MRLVHIYGGNLYGGVERLLSSFAAFGGYAPELEQVFGLCYRGRLWQELEARGAEVHALGGVRASRPWQVAAARRRLTEWLQANRCDWALCHSWWPYAIFAPGARRAGVPVALWAHDTAGGQGWLELWAKRQRPDLLLTYSAHIAGSLERLYPGMRAEQVAAPVEIPAGLSEEFRLSLRRSLQTPAQATVILQVSRLERWKGHPLMLEALAELQAQPGWVAWIAGGAQRPQERIYLAELLAQAARLGVAERIRWLGERRDVAALMGAADIFCQPNTGAEPFGIVFLEALAAGLPVVTTALGGALDIVTPECGVLTAPRPAAVAAGLRELMEDPERRRALAAQAPARARMMSDPASQMQRLSAVLAAGAALTGARAASPAAQPS